MTFWKMNELELERFRPGIMSKAELGQDLIMAYMEIEAGAEDPGHLHSYDQCGIVLEGLVAFFIGDEEKVLEPNEAYFIPAGMHHKWKTFGSKVKLLDITPQQNL